MGRVITKFYREEVKFVCPCQCCQIGFKQWTDTSRRNYERKLIPLPIAHHLEEGQDEVMDVDSANIMTQFVHGEGIIRIDVLNQDYVHDNLRVFWPDDAKWPP